MSGITVDTSINLGHIITLISFLIAVITWGNTLKAQLGGLSSQFAQIDKRIVEVELKMDKLAEIQSVSRIYEYKLDDLKRRLEVLENRSSYALTRAKTD